MQLLSAGDHQTKHFDRGKYFFIFYERTAIVIWCHRTSFDGIGCHRTSNQKTKGQGTKKKNPGDKDHRGFVVLLKIKEGI